jgi:hypothetical protein
MVQLPRETREAKSQTLIKIIKYYLAFLEYIQHVRSMSKIHQPNALKSLQAAGKSEATKPKSTKIIHD